MPDILGLTINDLSVDQAVEQLVVLLNKPGNHLILTANPEILVSSFFNQNLYNLFKKADLILADGVGLILAARYLGQPIKNGRVTGVELLKQVCKKSQEFGFKIFLTGSDENVLDFATQNLKRKYKNVNIVGFKKGPIFSLNNLNKLINDFNNKELINNINYLKPNLIFVGFGSPKQEIWLNNFFGQIEPNLGIGIGGAIDYLSGFIKEPPILIKKIGLEWLWRLIKQPKRLIRIIKAILVFPILVILFKNRVPHRTGV